MEELFGAGLLDPQGMQKFDILCRSDAGDTRVALPDRAPLPATQSSRAAESASCRPSAAARPQSPSAVFYATTAHALAMAREPAPQTLQSSAAERLQERSMQRLGAADLRALRKREGVSETVFARCLHVRPETVIAWEAGFAQPSAKTLHLLAAIYLHGLSAVA
jgi:DNA-binding transcriptional regulator YiaG